MKTQQIARAGLCVALLAVSAWVSVPLGPIPFTLQTMALALIPAVLDRPTAILAVAVYLLLGAIGLPVFSGFSGGVMRLVGPTGGFLWGFLVGMIVATTLVRLLPQTMPLFARVLAGDVALLVISYACGTAQLMVVGSMGVAPAMAAAILPFILPDAAKLAIGAGVGCAVDKALSSTLSRA